MLAELIEIPPPLGLVPGLLTGEMTPAHVAARAFCLDMIKEFYGFDYRPDWHTDLDSLCLPAARNHYHAVNRGGFWTLSRPDGGLVATAGVRALGWKPELLREFARRYPDGRKVASLWRVYVRKDHRHHGVGKWLSSLAETEAARMGYTALYLHAASGVASTIAFWEAIGYLSIGEHEFSTHFDKTLSQNRTAVPPAGAHIVATTFKDTS